MAGIRDTIKKNEGYAGIASPSQRLDGSSEFGAYIGLGDPNHIVKSYKKAGVTPEMAGDLYGKEIVVGYGHMLTGEELREFFSNPEKYKNMTKEEAEDLLDKDIEKHEEDLDRLLESRDIDPSTLSESQYDTLSEMNFQMGSGTLNQFNKMFKAIKEQDWEKAAEEIKDSKMYNQTTKRAEQYMQGIQEVRAEESVQPEHVDNSGDIYSTFPSESNNPTTFSVPTDDVEEEADPLADLRQPESEYEQAQLAAKIADEEGEELDEHSASVFADAIEKEEAEEVSSLDSPEVEEAPKTIERFQLSAEVDPLADLAIQEEKSDDPLAGLKIEEDTQSPSNEVEEDMYIPNQGLYGNFEQDFMEADPEEKKDIGKSVTSAVAGAADAVTFGYADEAVGLVSDEAKEKVREVQKDLSDHDPVMFTTGNILGGIAMGNSVGNAMKHAKGLIGLAKKGSRASTIGAVEGGLYGTGSSERDDAIGIIQDGLTDAAIGGAIGGVLDVGSKILSKSGKAKPKKVDTSEVKEETVDAVEDFVTEAPKEDFNEVLEIVGEDRMEDAITKSIQKAKHNREVNHAMLESIEDLAENEGLKELLSTKGNLEEKLEAFIDKVPNAEVFGKMGPPAELPPKLAKFLEKNPDYAKALYAYSNWRNEALGYARWLGDQDKGRRSIKDIYDDLMGKSQPYSKEVANSIDVLKKSGRINQGSYSVYKMQQNLAEEFYNQQQKRIATALIEADPVDPELAKKMTKEVIQDMLQNDPMGKMAQKLTNANTVAEITDASAGTDFQDIIYKLQQSKNLKTGWENRINDVHKRAVDLRNQYPEISSEEIIEMIESGTKHPLADAYRDTFRSVRENSNKLGVNIDEYGLGQDKYVKLKKKSGSDLIKAFENRWDELEDGILNINRSGKIDTEATKARLNHLLAKRKELRDITFEIDHARSPTAEISGFARTPEEMAMLEDIQKGLQKEVNALAGGEPIEFFEELDEFRHLLSKHSNRTLETVDDISEAMKKIRSKTSLQNSINPDISAIFQREGTLPMWIRETNIDKLVQHNMSEVGRTVFYQPLVDQIQARTPYLKAIGMKDMAEYFNKYAGDIMGRSRNTIKDSMQLMKTRLELAMDDSELGKLALGMWNYGKTSLYPNFLGLNPRAILRNLSQPLTMTMPELGVEYTGKIAKNMSETLRDYLTNPAKFKADRKRFADMGIVTERAPRPEDMEGIKAGLTDYFQDSKLARHADRFIDKWNDVVMRGYAMSDTLNRMATAKTVDNLVDDLFDGNAAAMRAIKNTPESVQKKMQLALDNGMGKNSLKEILMRHYDVQTQLAYGNIDMHELGRDLGPLFTMLTKWPVSIAGDVYKKVKLENGKGVGKALKKYMAPLVIAAGADAMIDYEDNDVAKELIGPKGFASWMPANSVLGNPIEMYLPVPAISGIETGQSLIKHGIKEVQGDATRRDREKIGKGLKRSAEQYIPVVGGAMRFIDRINNATGNKDED